MVVREGKTEGKTEAKKEKKRKEKKRKKDMFENDMINFFLSSDLEAFQR